MSNTIPVANGLELAYPLKKNYKQRDKETPLSALGLDQSNMFAHSSAKERKCWTSKNSNTR